jgi:uncharacterized OB-fold protein
MTNSTSLPVVPMSGALSYPPRHSAFTQTFWKGLSEGRWQTSCCNSCNKITFPPKPVCPHCWSTEVSWKSIGATGTLYAWTRVHAAPAVFAHESPYAVGIVDLDDGLRLACRLTAAEGVELVPDMRVEMVALQYEDGALFAARPLLKNTAA